MLPRFGWVPTHRFCCGEPQWPIVTPSEMESARGPRLEMGRVYSQFKKPSAHHGTDNSHCRPWPTWNLAESEFVFLKVNAWKRLTITFPPAFLIHLWLLYTKQYASSSYWLSCYTQSISMCACCQHTHGRLFRLTLKLTRLFEWFTGIRCAERSYFAPSLILSHRWIFHETAIFIAIFTSNMLLPPCFSVGLISYSKFTFPTTELGTVNHCCISIIFWEPNATELFLKSSINHLTSGHLHPVALNMILFKWAQSGRGGSLSVKINCDIFSNQTFFHKYFDKTRGTHSLSVRAMGFARLCNRG